MKTKKNFPNGFDSWIETYHEITKAITLVLVKDVPTGLVASKYETQGYTGMYELAEQLTDKFEKEFYGWNWDGDFFETIDKWIEKEFEKEFEKESE